MIMIHYWVKLRMTWAQRARTLNIRISLASLRRQLLSTKTTFTFATVCIEMFKTLYNMMNEWMQSANYMNEMQRDRKSNYRVAVSVHLSESYTSSTTWCVYFNVLNLVRYDLVISTNKTLLSYMQCGSYTAVLAYGSKYTDTSLQRRISG